MCAESVEGLNLKEIRQGRKNRFYSPVIISMNSKGKPDFKNENLNVIKKKHFYRRNRWFQNRLRRFQQ